LKSNYSEKERTKYGMGACTRVGYAITYA